MARIRTIKPEFWEDYRLARELTRDQRLLYIGLWNQADDEGRFLAHPRRLLGAIFPYDADLQPEFIEDSLRVLAETGRLVLYEVDGEPYGELTKFAAHQRINRPTPSRIPPPPADLAAVTDNSVSAHGASRDDSPPEQGTGNREQGRGTGKRKGKGSAPRGGAAREQKRSAPAAPSKPPEPSWSSRACDAWIEVMGGQAPGGRIGKALKPLVEKYGEDEVLYYWRLYLERRVADGEPEFATPQDFATRYGAYKANGAGGGRRRGGGQEYDYGKGTTEPPAWKG